MWFSLVFKTEIIGVIIVIEIMIFKG